MFLCFDCVLEYKGQRYQYNFKDLKTVTGYLKRLKRISPADAAIKEISIYSQINYEIPKRVFVFGSDNSFQWIGGHRLHHTNLVNMDLAKRINPETKVSQI